MRTSWASYFPHYNSSFSSKSNILLANHSAGTNELKIFLYTQHLSITGYPHPAHSLFFFFLTFSAVSFNSF